MCCIWEMKHAMKQYEQQSYYVKAINELYAFFKRKASAFRFSLMKQSRSSDFSGEMDELLAQNATINFFFFHFATAFLFPPLIAIMLISFEHIYHSLDISTSNNNNTTSQYDPAYAGSGQIRMYAVLPL